MDCSNLRPGDIIVLHGTQKVVLSTKGDGLLIVNQLGEKPTEISQHALRNARPQDAYLCRSNFRSVWDRLGADL